MEEDKYQEGLNLNEITIEEITPGDKKDRVPAFTALEKMLRAYLDFLDIELEEIALVPVGENNDHYIKLKMLVKPESLMDPEQKKIEAEFKKIMERF